MMCVCSVVTLFLLAVARAQETDRDFWRHLAKNELDEALKVKWNTGIAKNVILFIGDGMGPNTVTATRIYKGGESHRLVYEEFPHMGLLKTYSANKIVPDSACTATALLCGEKTNQMLIGVSAAVNLNDCPASLEPENRLKSLAALALEAGKSAGFVTTMRVTHATPAPLYGHSANRVWECSDRMKKINNTQNCMDHAHQLVKTWPGKDLNVILGGGRQIFIPNATASDTDPIDKWVCYRTDGEDLVDTYKKDKDDRGFKYSYVSNTEELKNVDVDNTDYLFGLFANGHMQYEHLRDKTPLGQPSITEMTEAAIKVLRKNKKGYFLMVEGGNIDMAHHRGKAKKAINESSTMEDAVQRTLELIDTKDTLLIVTSDHTHTLIINGYPYRGTDIFGMADKDKDGKNYTILTYGTGGPGSFQYYEYNGTVARMDPSLVDTKSFEYEQIAPITAKENAHGGGDVTVYAKGPWAHLFHNVHEQHYVYYAISYAAQIGEFTNGSQTVCANIFLITTILLCILLCLQ